MDQKPRALRGRTGAEMSDNAPGFRNVAEGDGFAARPATSFAPDQKFPVRARYNFKKGVNDDSVFFAAYPGPSRVAQP